MMPMRERMSCGTVQRLLTNVQRVLRTVVVAFMVRMFIAMDVTTSGTR